jgi:serine/threonine protein kinase
VLESADLPKPGQKIGRYSLDELLGEGGMGAVFAATNDVTGRAVAIKWMLPAMARSAEAVARFLAEARATARIEHPNVIQVLDVGQDGPAPFLVMERLRGESLGERLERVGRLSVSETLAIMIPACRGIAEAHAEGIIHRDLKPDNIFLCQGKDGSKRPPKVLDFGISKLYEEGSANKLTQTGAIMGTPLYMSPEQISARLDPDPSFDIYAVGVVLYECLAGQPPFDGDSLFALLQKIGTGDCRPLHVACPDVPEEVSNVVMRAMHADRAHRHPTIKALITDLESLQSRGFRSNPSQGQAPYPSTRVGPPNTGPVVPKTQDGGHRSGPVSAPDTLRDSGPRTGPTSGSGAVQAQPTHAHGGGGSQTPMWVFGLAIGLLVLFLAVMGGGIFWCASRGPGGGGSTSGNAPGAPVPPTTPSAPAAPATGNPSTNPAPGSGGQIVNAPTIDLMGRGSCTPSFHGRTMVIASQGTITITTTQGFRVSGNLTVGFPQSAVEAGQVSLSSQGRIDHPDTIVHLMQDQTMWMNLANDATGVLGGGAPDPISGRIVIRSFDADTGVSDLTFENVVLQNTQDEGLCTLNGTVRTVGTSTGF